MENSGSPVIVFGAMVFEIKPLLRRLQILREENGKEGHLFEARLGRQPVWVVRCGVGKKNAERAALWVLGKTTPRLVLSAGICGAVAPSIKVGDTVLSIENVDGAKGERWRSSFSQVENWAHGLLVTVEEAAGRSGKESLQRVLPEAVVCDMETSALAKICAERKIPWAALRTVSDSRNAELPPDEILVQRNLWRQLKMLFVHYQFHFPAEFFRLLKLGWNCRYAAKKNAQAVLKFLSFFVDTILEKS